MIVQINCLFLQKIQVAKDSINKLSDANIKTRLNDLIKKIKNENRLLNTDLIEICTKKSVINSQKIQSSESESAHPNLVKKQSPTVKKEFLNLTQLNQLYHNRKYQEIFKEYQYYLNNHPNQLNSKNLSLLTRSIYEAKSFDLIDIKNLITILKEKNLSIGFNSIIDLYFSIINKVDIF